MTNSTQYTLATIVVFAVALIGTGCSKDAEVASRPFRMGFTPIPYELSEQGLEYTYDMLSEQADIVSHHFDNGVPWQEALNGEGFPRHIMDDWNYRVGKADVKQKTLVSVTPINFAHNGLAAYRGSEDNMPLPFPWGTYAFNHDDVKVAYLNYCRRVIDFFQADYFAMSIETNLLYMMNPHLWSDYLELHAHVYQQLKREYPELPVFCSVAGAPVLKGFIDGNDHVQQRLAVMQLLQLSDFYAVSFYPYLNGYLGNTYPENTFDELFSISTKPVVVTETGYTAETFSKYSGHDMITIQSDPVKQQQYLNDLLAAAEKWQAEFIIYFTIRDLCQIWSQTGSSADVSIAGRGAGLFDGQGNPRPAMNSWREWFKKRVKPDVPVHTKEATLR
jgi:hypothetical protein